MKFNTILLVALLAAFVTCIPWRDQIALVNSLQVGRKEDPNVWGCNGCDQTNKPLKVHVIEENVKDVKAILSVYNEYTVLAFRYTATIKNVFQDLLWAIQKQDEHACKGCKVQKQMDNMWNAIRKDTLDDLRESSHTNRLIITGISLGGALTCLSYVDIAHSGIFENIELVTFGAPRVGNKKWAAWFDSQTPSTRYFIKNDPIAVLPVCLTLICNYQQTGTAIRCNKKNQDCAFKSRKQLEEESEPMDIGALINAVESGIWEHMNHEDDSSEGLDGLLDHIYGYPAIKEYTFIE